MLSIYVDGEHQTWDTILPYVFFAYNPAYGIEPTVTMTLHISLNGPSNNSNLRNCARSSNNESTPADIVCDAATPNSTLATEYRFGSQAADLSDAEEQEGGSRILGAILLLPKIRIYFLEDGRSADSADERRRYFHMGCEPTGSI